MDILTYTRLVLVPFVQARLHRTDDGAAMVEYGLLVALIAIVAITALSFVGTSVSAKFTEIGNCLSGKGC